MALSSVMMFNHNMFNTLVIHIALGCSVKNDKKYQIDVWLNQFFQVKEICAAPCVDLLMTSIVQIT